MPQLDAHDGADARRLDALLEQVAAQDRPAFDALYQQSAGRLFAICLRLLRDRGEAEDVLQEVFVTVWHKAPRFDRSKASAMTWLSMLARNRAIDRLRAAPPRALDDVSIAEELPDGDLQPAQLAEHNDESARLTACLQALEPRRRSLIRAAFLDGASHDELARRLATPLGTVKSWIRRGLSQLRVCLEP
ncbi:sigma-70 family RNA polymerase sigma factor [Stenotrophomonas sp. 169]|uniref:sigma-70 family RNA polymerase sigma factor n=1 Tax=unclassified Stenotrophomonas TaxID=196198 RepID=UPI0016623392|nr:MULTISPECIES: sigma-70 family RNA polymerase sigma factor [unclassified Stenotrophomonas]MBD8637240.1 sigma-70 family RNA polymerase sigma factor [Stenotrophomonas sp. CFBP 13725]MBD8697995.1 sigma-70 family RNA polymerase sigma factor [Stenotrophomonas sp. CFBP 13718]QNR97559.1 sigma-70 family RNA polymerase sigma factor [Stenotrophomonas sp. 169]